ncbi:hypothetical protein AB0K68_12500 [Streptomyces sp. NPDC050698]
MDSPEETSTEAGGGEEGRHPGDRVRHREQHTVAGAVAVRAARSCTLP